MWFNILLLGVSLILLFDDSLSTAMNQLAQTYSGPDGWSQVQADSHGNGYGHAFSVATEFDNVPQDYELWYRKRRQADFNDAGDFLETEEDQVLVMQEHNSNNRRSKRAPCKKKNKQPQNDNNNDDEARRRKRQIEYEYDVMPETEGFGTEIEIQEGDMILVQENRPQLPKGDSPKFRHHPHEPPLHHEPLPHERHERSPADTGEQNSGVSSSSSGGDVENDKEQQNGPPFHPPRGQGRRGPPPSHGPRGPPIHRGPPSPPPLENEADEGNQNQGDDNNKERKRRQATSLDSLLNEGFDPNNLPADFANNLPVDFDVFNIGDNFDPNKFTQGNAPTAGSDPNIIQRFMEGIRKIINFFKNLDPQKRIQNVQTQQVAP